MKKLFLLFFSFILTQALAGEFVRINGLVVQPHFGSNIQYYKNYNPHYLDENNVEFPVNSCYQIDLEHCGDVYFFFNSAIQGNKYCNGQPIQVLDPEINWVVAVRGKPLGSQSWIQFYIGLSENKIFYEDGKKIYDGKILCTICKDYRPSWVRSYLQPSVRANLFDCKFLYNTDMAQEIRRQRPDVSPDWNNPEFVKLIEQGFCKRKKFHHLDNQMLVSSKCYWPQKK